MIYKFCIEQRLPGLNELINANRTNKYRGAQLKKDTEQMISLYILNAVNNGIRGSESVEIFRDMAWEMEVTPSKEYLYPSCLTRM